MRDNILKMSSAEVIIAHDWREICKSKIYNANDNKRNIRSLVERILFFFKAKRKDEK